MFSVWPELFTYQLVAVSVLRIVAGYFFLHLGLRLLRAAWQVREQRTFLRALGIMYGIGQTIVGVLLVIGLYTQPAALVGALCMLIPVGTSGRSGRCEQHMRVLLFAISLSILFLGPGIFAFDLPI